MGKSGTGRRRDLLYPVIIFRAVIEAGNGLHSLGNSDTESKKHKADLIDNAGAGQRNGLSVYRQGAVMAQGIVHNNLHQHHSQLIKTLSHTQRHGVAQINHFGPEMLSGK